MDYTFDHTISRENTSCVKYDQRTHVFGTKDVTPLWVADMDFATPEFIRNAIIERTVHPILGYTFISEDTIDAAIGWMHRRHGWKVKPEWISLCPGIVPALNFAVLANSEPSDKVIIQPPVYTPFFAAITDHKRIVVENPLKESNGYYTMDLDHLEARFKDGSKLLILSNPHNPVGRVYTKPELDELALLTSKYGITVVSDEIHSDIIMPGSKHIPFASISEDTANRTITFVAPSKTFNVAGLSTGIAIIPNELLRRRFNSIINSLHLSMGNIFGIEAMRAAYTHGDEWVDSLIQYLHSNLAVVNSILSNENTAIHNHIPEGTYLSWLDFRELRLPQNEINRILTEVAKAGLSDGTIYGNQGLGFQRFNVASPRSVIESAATSIAAAFTKR
jgi:cystathionine beta-lyase